MILVIAVTLISLAIGRVFLGNVSRYSWTWTERIFIGFALGYGFFAYLIYLVGMVGFFKTLWVGILLTMMSIASTAYLFFLSRGKLSLLIENLKKLYQMKEQRILFLWILSLFFLLFLGSFLPPTAHDALCYHLNIPKRWGQDGVIGFYPYLVNSLFPFLIQIYYGLGILFNVDYAAHLFQLLCAGGTALGVFALAKRYGGLGVGLVAALVLISTPGIFNQANLPLNDISLMFFSFAMVYTVYLGVENKFEPRFFILAGMLGGFAMGVKYFAVLHITAAGIATLVFAMKQKISPSRILICLGLFCAAVFIFGSAWYIRAWILEGNPVYPYFSNVFQAGESAGYNFAKQGYGKGVLNLILLPWQATMMPQKFGGTWTNIGLVYLVFLPLIFLKDKKPHILFFKITALFYFIAWFFVVQNLRFLYFVFPLLSVFIALKARPFKFLLYLLLLLNALFAIYHTWSVGRHYVTSESREEFLLEANSYYRIVEGINHVVSKGQKILVSDLVQLYYLDAEPIRASEFYKRRSTSLEDGLLIQKLSNEGIGWIFGTKRSLERIIDLYDFSHVFPIGNDHVLIKLEEQ